MAYPNTTNPSDDFVSGIYTSDLSPEVVTAAIIDNYTPVNKDGMKYSLGHQVSLVQNFVNRRYLGRFDVPVQDGYITTVSGYNLVFTELELNSGLYINWDFAGDPAHTHLDRNDIVYRTEDSALLENFSGYLSAYKVVMGWDYNSYSLANHTQIEHNLVRVYEEIGSFGDYQDLKTITSDGFRHTQDISGSGTAFDTYYTGGGIEADVHRFTFENTTGNILIKAPYIFMSGIFQPEEIRSANGVKYVEQGVTSQEFKMISHSQDANTLAVAYTDKDHVRLSESDFSSAFSYALHQNVVSLSASLEGDSGSIKDAVQATGVYWSSPHALDFVASVELGFPHEPSYGTLGAGEWTIRLLATYY